MMHGVLSKLFSSIKDGYGNFKMIELSEDFVRHSESEKDIDLLAAMANKL